MILRINKESINNKIYYLLMLVTMYCSHDTLLFGTNADARFITVRKLVPFAIIALIILMGRLKTVSIKDVFVFVPFAVLPFLSAFFNGEDFDNYIYRAAIMLCAVLFVWTSKGTEFCLNYNSILYFLSIWSVSATLLANLLPSVTSLFPVVTNTAGAQCNNLLFSMTANSSTYGFVRNMSIFREPGVFAIFLTIAFVFELSILPKARINYMVVYTIAMLSTFSTAGYIILAIIYIYIVLLNDTFKQRYVVAGLLVVATVIATRFTNLLSLEGALLGKFSEGVGNYGSWFSRLSALTENWKIAIDNPFFGIGRYSLYDTVLATAGKYRAVDNTNTMMINFSAYGMIFGALSMWGLWRFVRLYQKRITSAICMFGIIFVALANEDMGQNVYYYFMILGGLACFKYRKELVTNNEATDETANNESVKQSQEQIEQ